MIEQRPVSSLTRSFCVPAALAGERVDRAISLVLDMPRARVSSLVASGKVMVDGAPPVQRSKPLVEGQVVEVMVGEYAPDVAIADSTVVFKVVYADEWIAVIDKPAGLVVHHGAAHSGGTLVDGLLSKFPGLGQLAATGAMDAARPGIVHRLDRETSGLMVVGLTPQAFSVLSAAMTARQVERRYTTLVSGTVPEARGSVDAPVGRMPGNPTSMGVTATGRHAVTHYTVQARFARPVETSLLNVRLETGRTHQIRVHMSSIGHPVIGDTRYKGPSWKSLGLGGGLIAEVQAGEGVDEADPGTGAVDGDSPVPLGEWRIFLHACRLSLEHPVTGRHMEWQSSLPSELANVLQRLESACNPAGKCHA